MHSWNHLQLLSCCVYSLSAAVGGSCVGHHTLHQDLWRAL